MIRNILFVYLSIHNALKGFIQYLDLFISRKCKSKGVINFIKEKVYFGVKLRIYIVFNGRWMRAFSRIFGKGLKTRTLNTAFCVFNTSIQNYLRLRISSRETQYLSWSKILRPFNLVAFVSDIHWFIYSSIIY